MATITALGSIATALTTLFGLWIIYQKKQKQKSIEEKAKTELSLAIRITMAASDEERIKLSNELAALRNPK